MSTGITSDLESCRRDVLNFLQMLRWRIASVEVKRWTADGMVLAVRRWQSEVSADLDELAHEIAWFITVSEVEAGATVLVRRAGR
jgi:hypothetical protein